MYTKDGQKSDEVDEFCILHVHESAFLRAAAHLSSFRAYNFSQMRPWDPATIKAVGSWTLLDRGGSSQ